MTTFENLSQNQKVRATLHRDVRNICEETCHYCGLEITKPAMAIIAELVLKKISVYGSDLEAFAKHAKRSSINAEDVKLLARRNLSLKTLLNNLCTSNTSNTKDKRRKTSAPTLRNENPTKKKIENVQDATLAKKSKNEDVGPAKHILDNGPTKTTDEDIRLDKVIDLSDFD